MTKYLKVRIRKGAKPILIEVTRVPNDRVVIGYRVRQDGERYVTETHDAEQHHVIVCTRDDIVCEMRMNNHYAMLEPVR